MIKKICMVMSFMVVAMALAMPTSFAANWKWVYSTDHYGYYFDTDTASKTEYGTAYVWLKARKIDGAIFIMHEKIWNKGWAHSLGLVQTYDANGHFKGRADKKFQEVREVVPGTSAEKIFPAVWRWTMDNGKNM